MQYKYVIVANDGTSFDLSRDELFVTDRGVGDRRDLSRLLSEGWRPIRETQMGHGSTEGLMSARYFSTVLVLLEHD
jgi:hypothetical protein